MLSTRLSLARDAFDDVLGQRRGSEQAQSARDQAARERALAPFAYDPAPLELMELLLDSYRTQASPALREALATLASDSYIAACLVLEVPEPPELPGLSAPLIDALAAEFHDGARAPGPSNQEQRERLHSVCVGAHRVCELIRRTYRDPGIPARCKALIEALGAMLLTRSHAGTYLAQSAIETLAGATAQELSGPLSGWVLACAARFDEDLVSGAEFRELERALDAHEHDRQWLDAFAPLARRYRGER